MDFPIFRKYNGIDVWFKILNPKQFIEIKKLGSKTIRTEINATIYPEIQFINDMMHCYEDRWVIIDKEEFNSALAD